VKHRFLTLALIAVSWALFALAVAWPSVALLVRAVDEARPPTDGFTFTMRQLGLLWRSLWLSGVATIAAMMVSLPGAYVVGRSAQLTRRPWLVAAMAAILLCPPMVYAFGWGHILPADFSPYARCIGVWALWAWPIPALLLGTGWARTGRQAYEAATLDTSAAGAFTRVVIPSLGRYMALSVILLFVLFLGDYGVPHACGLLVYATELLGWASSSRHVIDTLWPSVLALAMTCLALVMALMIWRWREDPSTGSAAMSDEHGTPRSATAIAMVCFAVSWGFPLAALASKLGSPQVLIETVRVYGRDLVWTLAIAILAGLVAVAIGLGIALSGRRLRIVAAGWAVLFFALPGALVGEAIVAAYSYPTVAWFFDHWPVVTLSYVARFGWIGVATALVLTSQAASNLADQARTDGAGTLGILRHVYLPLGWPAILSAIGVIAALAVAELPTTTLTRVPSFAPIAHVIIEKFHRFEDGMLVSLSFCLVGFSLLVILLLGTSVRHWGMGWRRPIRS